MLLYFFLSSNLFRKTEENQIIRLPFNISIMVDFGLIIRTLLVKGYLIGNYDENTISKINSELRPLNMRVKPTHQKNKLVLIDTNPNSIKNKQIIENLDQFITNQKKMDKTTKDLFVSLNWIEYDDFTDVFFLQNEEYLSIKYTEFFKKCQYCDILIHGEQNQHSYCQKLYDKHLEKMGIDSQ